MNAELLRLTRQHPLPRYSILHFTTDYHFNYFKSPNYKANRVRISYFHMHITETTLKYPQTQITTQENALNLNDSLIECECVGTKMFKNVLVSPRGVLRLASRFLIGLWFPLPASSIPSITSSFLPSILLTYFLNFPRLVLIL